MKNHKSLSLVLFAALLALSMQSARGQGTESKLANIASGGSSVRWDMAVSHSGGTLTISAPDGRVFRKEIRAGGSPDFTLTDAAGERLPDGVYTYELRLAPAMTMALKESMKSTRAKDDASEVERSTRKRPMTAQMVESGSFSIINGTAVVAGTMEERQTKETAPQKPSALTSVNYSTRRSNHRVSRFSFFDDVIADDLIVQGSACVGLDCVSGEVFGFDTITLK